MTFPAATVVFIMSSMVNCSEYPPSFRITRQTQPTPGAPNGSVPQNICPSGTFLLAGRCGRNNSPWKESVAGKKIIQGVRGDLKSTIAATGYLYGLLTTQDLNCAL